MKSNYKRLGPYIQQVDIRNKDDKRDNLLGVSVSKNFIESIANTVGTNFKRYKVVKKGQFTYIPDTSRRGDKIAVALLEEKEQGLVSQAYTVFEVIDTTTLLPEYLMMWFRRPEFDRYARFISHGSVREIFSWEDMCDVKLPIPPIEEQREIVREYNVIRDRIKLNNQFSQKLEETAKAVYKQWFIDFDFPDENGNPYNSSGGSMELNQELNMEIPKGWKMGVLSDIAHITMGQSPSGESYNDEGKGMVFYQGRSDFGFRYPRVSTYTTSPKKISKEGDILLSVRAPVGDLNISLEECCIGRGLASLSSKHECNSYLFYLMKTYQPQFDSSNKEGTVFGSLNKDTLNGLTVVYSEEYIRKFEEIVSVIDNQIKIYSEQNNKLISLMELLNSKMSNQRSSL